MTISYVQNVGNQTVQSGSSTTIVIPVTANTTVGNVVIAWCGMQVNQSTASINSVTDSRSNTWSIDADNINSSNGAAGLMSAVMTTALQNGDSITITLDNSYAYRSGGAAEFTGLKSSGGRTVTDLNVWVNTGGTSTSVTAGPSAQGPELVVTYAASDHTQTVSLSSTDSSSGGTWTAENIPANSYLNAGYEIASAVSSFNAAWSVSSNNVAAGIVSYEGPSSAIVPAEVVLQAVNRAAFY